MKIKKELADEHQIHVSTPTICRTMHEPVSRGGLGLSLLVKADIVERAQFRQRMQRGDFDHVNCIVIDEVSVGRNHARSRRGYGERAKQLVSQDILGK